ncbi:hypothetical protein C9374_011222 [Naegleria lovaniensis]|uniref:EGF-like domain-containing protein n=1 Tax=Naegleria lovaniensis TaxID=51637 RepID=A0AA88KQN2_NAELO|nr:uncharacterized protein C9374_011222 [Naegleria lovaniensis]KAG2392497.1 hypothetical protein C9374_011222 [Naegleria lovaniensis]
MVKSSSSQAGSINATLMIPHLHHVALLSVLLLTLLFHTTSISAWSYQQQVVASYSSGNPAFGSITFGPKTQQIYIAGGSKRKIYKLSGTTISELFGAALGFDIDLVTEASTTNGSAPSDFDLGYFAPLGNTASPISYYLWDGTSGSSGTGSNYGNTGTGLCALKISDIQLGSDPALIEYDRTYFITENSGSVVFGVTRKTPTNSVTLFSGTSTTTSVDGAIGVASVNVPGTAVQDVQYYNDKLYFMEPYKLRVFSPVSNPGSATITTLSSSFGVLPAFLSNLNNYLFISNAYTVKVIDTTNNVLATIAGTGVSPGTGVDTSTSSATSVNINPKGIVVTENGTIYFAEGYYIKKLNPVCDTNEDLAINSFPPCNCKAGYSRSAFNGTCTPTCSPACQNGGSCTGPNTCTCVGSWTGAQCTIPKCNGTAQGQAGVCNNRGSCDGPEICRCSDSNSWGGQYCQLPKCNGTLQNVTGVCNGQGSCDAPNVCRCTNPSYGGPFCEFPICYGILANFASQVCSGRGNCSSPNNCTCTNPSEWGGTECQFPKCNNILQGQAGVCNNRGTCDAPNVCRCSDSNSWGGQYCQLPKCNGTLQNVTGVCNGQGSCNAPNVCACTDTSRWGGQFCDIPKCYGTLANLTSVCNFGNGTCINPNTCQCKIPTSYTGTQCQYPICYGIPSNNASSCSGRGSCILPNTCKCHAGYYGTKCESTTCAGIASDNSTVCNGNGNCVAFNNCQCNSGYGPPSTCEMPMCFGYLANDSRVCNNSRGVCIAPNDCRPKDPICYGKTKNDTTACSGNGTCIDWDVCQCKTGYYGQQCELWQCNGKAYNASDVCSGHGKCISMNQCSCSSGWYNPYCDVAMCNGILANAPEVCNYKNGTCSSPGPCSCNSGYAGVDCSVPICFDQLGNSSSVCSSRGSCILKDTCLCDTNKYAGNQCQYVKCFGISSANSSQVCSGNGTCVDVDTCQCKAGYGGSKCDIVKCSNILATNSTVCSGRGVCYGVDKCQCDSQYFGSNCESTTCYGIPSNNASVCNFQNGTCNAFDQCSCNADFVGPQCQLAFIPSSGILLSFNGSKDYANETSTLLSLSINSLSFTRWYSGRVVRASFEYELNNRVVASVDRDLSSGNSKLDLVVPAFNDVGTVKAFVTLRDLSSSVTISNRVASSSSLTIEARATIPPRGNSNGGNDNAGAIAAGVVVPLVAIGAVAGVTATIVSVVVFMKKKAAAATAREIATAKAVDVELGN